MKNLSALAVATLCLAATACTQPAIAPANPFPVPVTVTQAGSHIYDALRACGQPGVDLIIGQVDVITTSGAYGPFAGMRVQVAPAYPGALVTVMNVPITPVLLGRVQGWAVSGPDC